MTSSEVTTDSLSYEELQFNQTFIIGDFDKTSELPINNEASANHTEQIIIINETSEVIPPQNPK